MIQIILLFNKTFISLNSFDYIIQIWIWEIDIYDENLVSKLLLVLLVLLVFVLWLIIFMCSRTDEFSK